MGRSEKCTKCYYLFFVVSAISACADENTPPTRSNNDNVQSGSFASGQALAENSVVERDFNFLIEGDNSCAQNCLSLVVNNNDTYDLGCNRPKPSCYLTNIYEEKKLKLKVNDKSSNSFKLVMTSAVLGANGRPKKARVAFDSSDKEHIASDVQYHINTSTPSSIDFWLNDNDDSDFHDFHGTLTGPSDIRFSVDNLTSSDTFYGNQIIDECKDKGTGAEACQWRYIYSNDCRKNKCSKLVIYFAGGQMSCADPINKPESYLANYARNGYVAICARLYETEPESGNHPFNKEAPRVDLLIKAITSDPVIKQAWNGEKLLLSGVSHGATAAVIAMAQSTYDSSAYWQGSKTTGACFFDGVYNARDALNRTFVNSCTIYPREFDRYCSPRGSSWPRPETCQSPDIALDTVVGTNTSNLAIKNWKIVECGSKTDFCKSDLVAAEPQQQLCNQINADKTKSCEWASHPAVSHDNCGVSVSNIAALSTRDDCLTWFDALK